jgi:hypothetical protein
MSAPVGSPLFPPVPRPASAAGAEKVILRCILSDLDAEAVTKEAIYGRKLSPADIEKADIEPARLLSVPFYRIEVSVDGWHFGLSGGSVGVGNSRIPIPTGGVRHKDAAIVVVARSSFPYEARVPAWIQSVVGEPPLEIATHELLDRDGAPEGETVDADLGRDDAERAAVRLLVRSVAPTNALYVKYEPKIAATTYVRYPVYWSTYTYDGEAKRHTGERFYVAVSGRNGKVIAAHHPSGLRAAAARFRRLLGG